MTQKFRDEKRARFYTRDTRPSEERPRCVYCGLTVWPGRTPSDSARGTVAATLDHVEPRAGNDSTEVVTACAGCNFSKGDKTLEEWGEAGGGVWVADVPAPAKTLAGRVMASIARPLCGERTGACSVVVARLAEERTHNADHARRARKARR